MNLDQHSGVPVYRQIVDQVIGGVASRTLRVGDQLPTVRQLAVDLAINPNTVIRAYRELEFQGIIETQQGSGTYVAEQKPPKGAERTRLLRQLTSDFVARSGAAGFKITELIEQLQTMQGTFQEEEK